MVGATTKPGDEAECFWIISSSSHPLEESLPRGKRNNQRPGTDRDELLAAPAHHTMMAVLGINSDVYST